MGKLKTHVITISRAFPTTHKRKGEPTEFIEQIISGQKIHTIRGSVDLWEKRIKEVQENKAVLSLRYWTGKPYHSNQQEFAKVTASDKPSTQRIAWNIIDGDHTKHLAKNDGLSDQDFKEWFRKYPRNPEGLVIIHFTNFRYKTS